MQSIDELRYLVKMGAISEAEAEDILGIVVDRISDNKRELEKNSVDTKTLILTGILGPLSLAGIGVGTSLLTDYLDERKQNKKLEESYSLMNSVNSDMENIPEEKRQQAFSILRSVSPTIAQNPILAANFVQRHTMNYGGAGFEEAANLARAEAALAPREPGIGKQISGQLIQQGIGNVGGFFSSAGSRGLAEAVELTPEEQGIADAISLMSQESALGNKKYLMTKEKLSPEEAGTSEADKLISRYNRIGQVGDPVLDLNEYLGKK